MRQIQKRAVREPTWITFGWARTTTFYITQQEYFSIFMPFNIHTVEIPDGSQLNNLIA